jgi:hypothetical protein
MERKKLVTVAVISVIMLLTIFVPILLTQAVDLSSWYTTVSGVLDSDYYLLYPFAKTSLNVGFSKFGELVGIPASGNQSVQSDWVGLEYGGRDPFCPADTVDMDAWVNGWYVRIEYICQTATNKDRKLFAFAMFSDGSEWGGDWQYAATPTVAPHGGRKTNGTCTTDALKILYDGPRRFIAQSVTHIYDKEGATTWSVLDLTITMIFDKDTKQVILLKDAKLKIAKTKLYGKVNVQLSNREQYDLGPSPTYDSFAHYYEQYGDTCYGPDWHWAKNLTRDYEQHITSTSGQTVFTLHAPNGEPIVSGFLKVYDDGVFKDPLLQPAPYTINWAAGTVTFTVAPTVGSDMAFHYKYVFKTEQEGQRDLHTWNHEYDIAQVISSDRKYVAWAGIWPPASDYTVDGMGKFLIPLSQCRETDMVGTGEPYQSPLLIAEWDFLLDHTSIPMYRAVEVKGVTDWHDADDLNAVPPYWTGVTDRIDREARYQLDMVFQSWDLLDAVEKQEYRWLYKGTVGSHTSEIQLTSGLGDDLYYAVMPLEYASLGNSTPTWTRYFLRETGGTYPAESKWVNEFENSTDAHSKNWALKLNSTADQESVKVTPIVGTPTITAPLTLKLKDLVDFDFWYKYISGTYGPSVQIKVYNSAAGGEAGHQWANIMAQWENPIKTAGWHHYTLNNITSYVPTGYADTPFIANTEAGPGSVWHSYEYFTNLYGDYYVGSICVTGPTTPDVQAATLAYVDDLSVAYLQRPSGIRYERVYNMEEDKLVPSAWDAYGNCTEKVIVDGALIARKNYQAYDPVPDVHRPYYTMNFINSTLKFYKWVSGSYTTWDLYGCNVKVLYSTIEENEKGRYEWAIMGRDAFTSDSLGGALVTAAFKNKDIEIGLSGLDMMYYEWSMASIPYVMNCFGTAPGARGDYKDDGSTPGQRPALRDDWCTTWPITSSNMIAIGGPLANMFTSYLNEFTDAFYGTYVVGWGETYTTYATWQNKIVALTCWNGTKKGYAATYDTGYAVISTYKDLNGTVGLTIWGHGPRDTYYASKFFHEEIIYELQSFPHCVTSIILKIDYTYPQHPTFTVVECLGTISERLVETTKGGIHDP